MLNFSFWSLPKNTSRWLSSSNFSMPTSFELYPNIPPSYFASNEAGAGLAAVPPVAGFADASTGRGCPKAAPAHKNNAIIRKYIRFMEVPFLKILRGEN
jgi:hypothetical protein